MPTRWFAEQEVLTHWYADHAMRTDGLMSSWFWTYRLLSRRFRSIRLLSSLFHQVGLLSMCCSWVSPRCFSGRHLNRWCVISSCRPCHWLLWGGG